MGCFDVHLTPQRMAENGKRLFGEFPPSDRGDCVGSLQIFIFNALHDLETQLTTEMILWQAILQREITNPVALHDRILIVRAHMNFQFETQHDLAHQDLSSKAISTSIWPNIENLSSSAFVHFPPRSDETSLTALLWGVPERL